METDPGSGHITGTVLGIVADGTSQTQILADLRTDIAMAFEDPVISARATPVARVVPVDV